MIHGCYVAIIRTVLLYTFLIGEEAADINIIFMIRTLTINLAMA